MGDLVQSNRFKVFWGCWSQRLRRETDLNVHPPTVEGGGIKRVWLNESTAWFPASFPSTEGAPLCWPSGQPRSSSGNTEQLPRTHLSESLRSFWDRRYILLHCQPASSFSQSTGASQPPWSWSQSRWPDQSVMRQKEKKNLDATDYNSIKTNFSSVSINDCAVIPAPKE